MPPRARNRSKARRRARGIGGSRSDQVARAREQEGATESMSTADASVAAGLGGGYAAAQGGPAAAALRAAPTSHNCRFRDRAWNRPSLWAETRPSHLRAHAGARALLLGRARSRRPPRARTRPGCACCDGEPSSLGGLRGRRDRSQRLHRDESQHRSDHRQRLAAEVRQRHRTRHCIDRDPAEHPGQQRPFAPPPTPRQPEDDDPEASSTPGSSNGLAMPEPEIRLPPHAERL